MKVKAKNWINVSGEWHQAGDIFEIESIDGIEGSVEVIAEPKSAEKPEVKTETTPKRKTRASANK